MNWNRFTHNRYTHDSQKRKPEQLDPEAWEACLAKYVHDFTEMFKKNLLSATQSKLHHICSTTNEQIADDEVKVVGHKLGNIGIWRHMLNPLDKWVILDLETSGLDINSDEIIQIGLVFYDEQVMTSPMYYSKIVKPKKYVSNKQLDFINIDRNTMMNSCSFKDIINTLRCLFADSVVIGYNIHQFDLPIIDRECKDAGEELLEFDYSIDILSILKDAQVKKLDLIHPKLSKNKRDRHQAVNDCFRTLDIMLPIIELHNQNQTYWTRSQLNHMANSTTSRPYCGKHAIIRRDGPYYKDPTNTPP